jgi:hypothetical protein
VRKFLFVAPLRVGTTSIENALSSVTEIRISRTDLGKHLVLAEIEERFRFLFRLVPLDDFFVFSCIRDPVEWLSSLYTFHKRAAFKDNRAAYTGDLDFPEFYRSWTERNSWMLRPQHHWFCDESGVLRADLLLRVSHLQHDFETVKKRLQLPRKIRLRHVNRTFAENAGVTIPATLAAEIRARYAIDDILSRLPLGAPTRGLRPAELLEADRFAEMQAAAPLPKRPFLWSLRHKRNATVE